MSKLASPPATRPTSSFSVFFLDGASFRLLSGALHYFWVLPELWDDRLGKLKALGLNAVETYVAWNLHDRKGLLGGVRLDYTHLTGWTMFPLPLDDLSGLEFAREPASGPTFYRTTVTLNAPADTFIDMSGWRKGVVWVNGFNLGRYWEVGPQRTLYLPAPLLRAGKNEIVVLELHDAGRREVTFRATPDLG